MPSICCSGARSWKTPPGSWDLWSTPGLRREWSWIPGRPKRSIPTLRRLSIDQCWWSWVLSVWWPSLVTSYTWSPSDVSMACGISSLRDSFNQSFCRSSLATGSPSSCCLSSRLQGAGSGVLQQFEMVKVKKKGSTANFAFTNLG